jgi:hypothetical protein
MPVNQDPVEMQSTPPSILCCAAPPRKMQPGNALDLL